MSLGDVLRAAIRTGSGLQATVPADWHQGRTAFGGFSTGLALSAALEAAPGLPPLRSAQVSFIGPVAGEIEVGARVLRQGRNATWVGTELSSGGKLSHAATFVFMGAMASAVHVNLVPRPAAVTPPNEARAAPKSSAFLEHFDYAYAGPPPGEGEPPEVVRWVRLRDRAGIDPMVGLLCVADVLPPGVMRLTPPGTPISSMTWLCNLLSPAPRTEDGWWLLRSVGTYAENGCSAQEMTIWNTAGEPVASGMQSVALFG